MEKQKLKECFAKAFEVNASEINDLTSQLNLQEWDSLRHLNLIVELEIEFDVEFEPEEISEMKDFEKVLKCLENKLK